MLPVDLILIHAVPKRKRADCSGIPCNLSKAGSGEH